MTRLSFGLGILTGQTLPGGSIAEAYRAIPRLAEAAERHGFDSIWLSAHHGAEDGWLPAMFPMLGALAAVTDRLLLGTEDLNPAFSHPLRLAEDAATIDLLSRGRLLLGLALGWRPREFTRFGVDRADQPARLAEIIGVLRAAWSGDPRPFGGRFVQLPGQSVQPRPCQPAGPPILLSIARPAQRAWAAGLADAVMFSRSGPSAAETQPRPSDIRAAHAEHAPTRPLTVLLNAFVADGDPWPVIGPGHDHQFHGYAAWRAEAAGQPATTAAADAMVAAGRRLMLAGPPDRVAAGLLPFVTALAPAGPLRLMLKLHYPGVDPAITIAAMRRFAQDVAPALLAAAETASTQQGESR